MPPTTPHRRHPDPDVGYFNLQANSLPGIRLWLDANNIDGDDTADSIPTEPPSFSGSISPETTTTPGRQLRESSDLQN